MKKKLSVCLMSVLATTLLVGCGGGSGTSSSVSSSETSSSSSSSSSEKQKISVTLDKSTLTLHIGETGQLVGTPSVKGATLLWNSTDSLIASVSKNGLVTGVKIGSATISVTTADALSATCVVTVIDEEVPSLPTGDDIKEVGATVETESELPTGYEVKKDATTGVTKITWTDAAFAAASNWKNDADFRVADGTDLSRSLKVNFVARASTPITCYFKVATEDWKTLKEGEITLTSSYSTSSIDIPTEQRYLLSETTRVLLYAPKPGSTASAGNAEVAHVYFSGDAEPGVAPGEYDPSKFDTIYDLPLSYAKKDGCYDDQTSGKITWSIDEAGEMVFVNESYNDWAPFAFKFPENNDEGTAIDYTGVEKAVMKVKSSENAIIKARTDWNGDFTELDVNADKADKWQYVVITLTKVTPWDTIFQIVPSYRIDATVTGTITVTVASISLVKAKQ